jgi:signal-transduction protein with cAMP-binding, CBS, and nucleotidyltransferase domain
VQGRPDSTPVAELVEDAAPAATLGDSAAEALIQLLDTGAPYLLVTDRTGGLRGVVEPRDFAVSPTTAGVAAHEQLRRAENEEQLAAAARRVPSVLSDLLRRGLASTKVIAVYSAILDTVVRRAVTLVMERHPELSVDAFTWLSLGSVGRREAVLSSDVDSAVAFVDGTSPDEADAYRSAFAEVGTLLAGCGISSDAHGATAQQRLFARTNAEWRAAAGRWLAAPEENQGAIMTWSALAVGSASLSTTERLLAAAGSEMMPQDSAETLVEVFEVLQRLRLRYQVLQSQRGLKPTDRLDLDEVSPLDRSVVAQAVREVAAVQRRMDNVSLYVPAEAWTAPRGS